MREKRDNVDTLSTQTVSGATLTLVAGTAMSKTLGFIRDVITATFFGASATMDAFLVALSVPSLIGYSVGMSLSSAFMPTYTRLRREQGSNVGRFNRWVVIMASLTSAILAAFVLVFSRPLIGLIAPHLAPESIVAAVAMTRVLSLAVIIYVLYYLATGIYQAMNHFVTPAFLQPVENILIIIILVALHSVLGINALILSTILGVAFVLFLMMLRLLDLGVFEGSGAIPSAALKDMIAGTAPLVVVYSVHQGYFLIERYFASMLPAGSISSLTYARRIIELPTIFLVSTLTSAIYPRLSNLFIQNDRQSIKRILLIATEKLHFFLIPMSVTFLLWSGAIVTFLFQRGEFGTEAVRSTSEALFYYGLCLIPLAGIALTSKVLFAANNMRVPFFGSLLGVVVCIAANILLRPALGIGGIALSTTIMMYCIYAFQTAYLFTQGLAISVREIAGSLWWPSLSTAASLVVVWVVRQVHCPDFLCIAVFWVSYLSCGMWLFSKDVLQLKDLVRSLFSIRG